MYSFRYLLYMGIHYFLRAIQFMMMLRAILSWFTLPTNRLYRFLMIFTEPFIAPFRALISRYQKRPLPIDISYFVAYFALWLIDTLVYRLIYLL